VRRAQDAPAPCVGAEPKAECRGKSEPASVGTLNMRKRCGSRRENRPPRMTPCGVFGLTPTQLTNTWWPPGAERRGEQDGSDAGLDGVVQGVGESKQLSIKFGARRRESGSPRGLSAVDEG